MLVERDAQSGRDIPHRVTIAAHLPVDRMPLWEIDFTEEQQEDGDTTLDLAIGDDAFGVFTLLPGLWRLLAERRPSTLVEVVHILTGLGMPLDPEVTGGHGARLYPFRRKSRSGRDGRG
ncbi:hypothetical protein [Nonomuraea sp. NPDC050786]|uniref:hypothetical protein n=1 Tax=Nonomuraea sp. NPDC050786 TaxID=3154840 RepID=UPI0033D46FF6